MKSYLFKLTPEIDRAKLKKQLSLVAKETNKVAKNFSKSLTKSFNALGKFAKGGFLTGVVAKLINPLEEINQSINDTLQRFDDIGKMSDLLGANAKELQALTVALQAKGLDQGQIQKVLNELQTEIGKTKSGDETAKFTGLAENENAVSLFAKIMNKIGSMEDINQAKALATSVFGEKEANMLFDAFRSGEEFANIFERAYKLSDENLIQQQHALQGYKDQETAIMELQVANERAQKINQQTIDLQLSEQKKRADRLTSQIGMQEVSSKTDQLIEDTKNVVQKGFNVVGGFLMDLVTSSKDNQKKAVEESLKNQIKSGDK